ncbi:DUF2079 domain-containing protein [Thermoplasma sp. Kam2015]|uniref:DUF2079 domain-containing protein n=1 Tax=Thermoplasma sp. Kam2015 TaxID=2094122 RepID=UPI0035169CAB
MIYFIIFPIYSLYPNPAILLIFQNTFITFGSIPLYLIAKKRIGSEFYAFLISVSWILYYPIWGVEWFDFHFMALFPTLFLTAVALLYYGKFRSSILAMYLAAITDYMAPLLILFFLLVMFMKKYKAPRYYYISLMIPFFIVFVIVNLYFGYYALGFLNYPYIIYHPYIITAMWTKKLGYFSMILLPFVFTPILSYEILAIVPYVGLSLVHTYRTSRQYCISIQR